MEKALEKTSSLLPPKGDKKLGEEIFRILDEVIKDKDTLGLPARWKRNAELAKNKFWKSNSTTVPLTTGDLYHQHRRRTINNLTDNNPTFNVLPSGDIGEDTSVIDKIHETVDYWWNESEQQAVFRKSVTAGEDNGIAIQKCVFNPLLKNGIGECETIVVDPFHFGIYPVTCTEIQKAYAVLHYTPKTIREIKDKYGSKADEVVADEELIKELGEDRREIMGGKPDPSRGYLASIGGNVKTILEQGQTGKSLDDKVLEVEIWVRDRSKNRKETVVESENRGGEIINKTKVEENPIYKGDIRRIVCCNMGKIILADDENPSINPNLSLEEAQKTYLFDKFPFATAQSNENLYAIWGSTDAEYLEPILIDYNKTLSQLTLFKDKMVRPKFMNPKTSGVSNGELNNITGIINPSNSMEAQGMGWTAAPQTPLDLYQYLETLKALFFLVSGQFDLDSTDFNGDVIAYKAIAALLERAKTNNRHKEMAYTALVRECGRMFLSNMMNWYTEDRYISVDQGGKPTAVPINGKQLRLPVNLMVVSGSTMPVSLVQRREEARELFKLGVLDQEEVLKYHDWPDYMAVVQRMAAGPLGAFLQKLAGIGVPAPLLQLFQQIGTMKPEEFKKSVKDGQIPDFMTMLKAVLSGQQENPQQAIEMQRLQAEAMEKGANAKKAMAETEKIGAETKALLFKTDAEVRLLAEKIVSEQHGRAVKDQGVAMDWKALDQKAAEVVSNIEDRKKAREQESARIVSDIESKHRDHARADVETAHDLSLRHREQDHREKVTWEKYRDEKDQGAFKGIKGAETDNET